MKRAAAPSFALLLVATALAGCAGGGGGDGGPTVDPLPVQVTETTGAIRCLVVDDRIQPVVAASVTARGATMERSTETDAEGRCAFSGLEPGTYFLSVTSPLHKAAQSSVDVEAGVADPPLTRVQVERLFTQDPYSVSVAREGFFECSQSGASVWYSSSTCVDGIVGPQGTEAYPPVSNVTAQDREWHSDVGPGWQAIVFEMIWEPTSQGTSTNMGMVVSTYKPEREGTHWFAEFEGGSPIRGQIDVGVEHESAGNPEPTQIPPEGMANMSYFVSVRGDGEVPGLSLNQRFTVYVTMFHYGRPPEGWSLVAGDEFPF